MVVAVGRGVQEEVRAVTAVLEAMVEEREVQGRCRMSLSGRMSR
jgi:hypothetical protein